MNDAKMWYIAQGNQHVGPLGKEDIINQIRNGSVTPETLLFTQGMSGWTPAGQVDEFRSYFSSVAPSTVPPVPPLPAGGQVAHEIDFEIFGEEMQFVEVELDPGESAVAEAGAMMYMDDGIEMETIFGDGSPSSKTQGFLDKMLGAGKRLITGESLFMTLFTNIGTGKKRVAFGAPYPGKIIPVDLKKMGNELICQKDAFLCAAKGVSIGIFFQKRIGVGLFGGEGFIMEKLEGDGMVFIHAGGTIVSKDLEPGQTIKVDTGCVVAFQPTVDFDISFVGNIKTALFGGEGITFAVLRGPGRVWLQSLPFSRLADRIYSAAPQLGGHDKGEGSVLNVLGGLGRLLDGD